MSPLLDLNLMKFLTFFLLLAFALQCEAAGKSTLVVPTGLVIPVVKDAASNQYIATIRRKTPLLPEKLAVDLGAGILWVNCETNYVSSSFKPVPCGSGLCKPAGAFGCTTECYSSRKPGCNNNTCSGSPGNPFTSVGTSGDVSQDSIAVVTTASGGKAVGSTLTITGFIFLCGSDVIVKGLAAGAVGLLGLGRTSVSVPSQLTAAFGMRNKFAICLPSSTGAASPGVIFFGGGPFVLQPGVDVTEPVAFTKLIVNPVSTSESYIVGKRSSEYFVKLTGIKVNEKIVPVNTTLLDIHKSKGGTKISTVDPYTKMEKSIYTAFEAAFVKEAAAMGVKRVAVPTGKPFGACFNSNRVSGTRVGPAVPTIDLLFDGASASWRVFGANSMVIDVAKGIMCLGFVNAGAEPRTSITIGAHQLEDNLLQFDMGSSKMGFSSSLLFRQTTCSNFNFKG